jgi:serine/threonine protein kinase
MGDEANHAMKPASPEQVLFAEALQCATPEARVAYLNAACGTDTALLRRVEALLRAAENAGDFLEEPPTGLSGDADSTPLVSELSEKPGDRIGRYKLLEKIGEGGCGVVYMAEQEEPVRRRVALKVIKLGMDTRSVVARFEAERQALALMDHPNIAKVLDGGATQTGRPYFVMELVRGVRITEFCDAARLSTEARLRIFVQVCQAIQHAHQKGIIHRDLKPSNILVTVNDGAPVPKVIDFGIAKATGQQLTDKTLFTQFHSFIGTPAYTSPEQAEMSSVDVDTRSDIYSLGVLLYELLTGRTPFDGEELLRSGLDEMRRIIREVEPIKPSTRLTQELLRTRGGKGEEEKRGSEAAPSSESPVEAGGAAVHSPDSKSPIDGDLDWIVMKCLEKDRSRRYETATGVAADIQRHLNNEPVVARPPSAAYRCRKTIARHQTAFAASATVVVVLIVGFTVSTWLFLKERDARQLAEAGEKVQAELRRESEAARSKAEAGQTALLYWQAFDAFPNVTEVEQNQLRTFEAIEDPVALAARYNDVFKLLHRAANIKSGCDWAINVEDGPETWTPNFRRIRHAADAACLRAHVALSNDDSEEARRNLSSVFVLGRHAAVDGSLVAVMAQIEVESRIIEFVAQHFGSFPSDVMTRFAEELRTAPARVDVARGARTEQSGGAQWLAREIQKAQIESAGDEKKAMMRGREILVEYFSPEPWAERVIAAAGGTIAGLIGYIRQTAPYYESLHRIATATPANLRIETMDIARAIENSTNLVVQRILPNLERARRREMEAVARLAMLEAANLYMREGRAGLATVRDPFGNGPLAHRPIDTGFELRSALSDYGYNGSLAFVTVKGR